MNETIEKIVAYAQSVTEPESIVLFGSVAEGKHTVYSDIDLLIIVKDSYHKQLFAKQIQSFARELSMSTDVLIYSQDEVSNALLAPLSFLASIVKSGKIIYKKDR
jgi:predicted nucleotidyltransferase